MQHWGADSPAGGEVGVTNCSLCDVMMSDGSGLIPQCMAQEVLLRGVWQGWVKHAQHHSRTTLPPQGRIVPAPYEAL